MDVKTAISGRIAADARDVLEVPFTGQSLLQRSLLNDFRIWQPRYLSMRRKRP